MYRVIIFSLAMTLAIIGTLAFMGAHRFGIWPEDATGLVGTGAFMFSGLAWCLYGFSFRKERLKRADD